MSLLVPHRHWCFTLNNYTDEDIEQLCLFVDDEVARYIVYGEEIAESTGTPHLQGYVEFHSPKRLAGVRKLFDWDCNKPHLEPRKGLRSRARDYCKKGEQSHDEWKLEHETGPNWGLNAVYHEHGDWVDGPGERTDLKPLRALVELLADGASDAELVETDPVAFARHYRGLDRLRGVYEKERAKAFRSVRVHTVVGKAGVGKSRAAFAFDDDCFVVNCANDQFPLNGYDGEKTILLDDFRGGIQYTQFLRILDGHRLAVNIKGGVRYALWDTVIISSNVPPTQWYKVGLTPELKRRLDTGSMTVIPEDAVMPPDVSCDSSIEESVEEPSGSSCVSSCEDTCESLASDFSEASDSSTSASDDSVSEASVSPINALPPLVRWLVERFKVPGNTTPPPWVQGGVVEVQAPCRPAAGLAEAEYASYLDSLLNDVYPAVSTRAAGS